MSVLPRTRKLLLALAAAAPFITGCAVRAPDGSLYYPGSDGVAPGYSYPGYNNYPGFIGDGPGYVGGGLRSGVWVGPYRLDSSHDDHRHEETRRREMPEQQMRAPQMLRPSAPPQPMRSAPPVRAAPVGNFGRGGPRI